MIHTTFPALIHPLYWALTHVVGLSRRDIERRTKLSTSTVQRLRDGAPVDDDTLRKLRIALSEVREQRMVLSRSVLKKHHLYEELEQLTQKILDELVGSPLDSEKQHLKARRNTELVRLMRANLSSNPTSRARVIALLGQAFSLSAILRVARRLQVRETLDVDGSRLWSLAPDITVPPPILHLEPPRFQAQPVGSRAERCQQKLHQLLLQAPNRALPASALIQHLVSSGFSRPLIFRIARTIPLIRETRGFGKDKCTTWSLPNEA